ncbi:MAG: hypothetical protein ACREJQ_07765 [bacterium]
MQTVEQVKGLFDYPQRVDTLWIPGSDYPQILHSAWITARFYEVFYAS